MEYLNFTVGQKFQLPKDYSITPLGLKTLKYKLVTWEVLEVNETRVVLKYKNIVYDTSKSTTMKKLDVLKNQS